MLWSLFDSPDQPGSGWRHMDRQLVYSLDDFYKEHTYWLGKMPIKYGYVSKNVGDHLNLPNHHPLRTGSGVWLEFGNVQGRFKASKRISWYLSNLYRRGIDNIIMYENSFIAHNDPTAMTGFTHGADSMPYRCERCSVTHNTYKTRHCINCGENVPNRPSH